MKCTRISLIATLLLTLPAYGGRSFNGSTDVITVPGVSNAIDLTGTQATWSCWFKLTSLPGSNTVAPFTKNSNTGIGYAMTISVSGFTNELQFYIYISVAENHNHDVTYSTPVTTNTWYNAVATYQNNNNLALYVNGVLVATDATVGSTGTLVSSGGSMLIGGTPQNLGCCNFPGTVAEIAIWNTRLSAGQLAALGTVCPVGASARRMSLPPPVGYWPLWGASGSSIEPDLSGNKITGTLTGTTQGNHPPCTQ